MISDTNKTIYLILSYFILSYLILSYLILSYLILSYLILSSFIFSFHLICFINIPYFRPSMADITLAHESYFSRSLPGSKLNRHLDERHEETKGRVFVLLKLLIEYIHWHVSTHTHTHIHTHTHTH